MNSRGFAIHTLEEDFEEAQAQVNATRVYRNRPDYIADMDDEDFAKRFRISKATCNLILDKIGCRLSCNTERNYALSPETKLLLALRFYASGSFLITVGDFCGLSIPSASRAVKQVSEVIASMAPEFIKFPHANEMQQTFNEFYKIAKFPKVIGAIDCTHVRIQSPGGENAELFRNRKGYFSLNVQAVCNANLMFQDVDARWPGSSHDSTIFNNSRLKFRLENREFNSCFILGDSGYKVCEYMMTPLLNPVTEIEKLYNESQIRTRNVIERCFGVWKRRFSVLSMGMRISVSTTMVVIVACSVLHNIATLNNDAVPPQDTTIPPEIFEDEINDTATSRNANARTLLISSYFASL